MLNGKLVIPDGVLTDFRKIIDYIKENPRQMVKVEISLIDGDRYYINLLEDSETTLTLEGVSVERPEEDVLIFYVAEKNLHLFVQ
jgi:predicted DNA binding protein